MTISEDVFFYTVAFVVPGFILNATLAAFTPQRREDSQLSFLRFFALSCVNNALWIWLILLIHDPEEYEDHPVRAALGWLVVVVVSPIGLGLVLTYQGRRRVIRSVLERIGFHPVRAIPTSWDHRLSQPEPCWMIVRLKDGTSFYGRFGGTSFASSDPGERDLYLGELYDVSAGGAWRQILPKRGVWIGKDEIQTITFIDQ